MYGVPNVGGQGKNDCKMKRLLSLYDFTGNWSDPYRKAGWEVVMVDIKHGVDILNWNYRVYPPDYFSGILAAQPCTAYSGSGARWWAGKDKSGETAHFDSLTRKTLEIIEYFRPGLDFWVLENPVGRIAKRVPELAKYRLLTFNPCEFGDPYTKRTVLYGELNPFLVRSFVKPVHGSKMHKFPPGPERAALRSETPKGFSAAFYMANN